MKKDFSESLDYELNINEQDKLTLTGVKKFGFADSEIKVEIYEGETTQSYGEISPETKVLEERIYENGELIKTEVNGAKSIKISKYFIGKNGEHIETVHTKSDNYEPGIEVTCENALNAILKAPVLDENMTEVGTFEIDNKATRKRGSLFEQDMLLRTKFGAGEAKAHVDKNWDFYCMDEVEFEVHALDKFINDQFFFASMPIVKKCIDKMKNELCSKLTEDVTIPNIEETKGRKFDRDLTEKTNYRKFEQEEFDYMKHLEW